LFFRQAEHLPGHPLCLPRRKADERRALAEAETRATCAGRRSRHGPRPIIEERKAKGLPLFDFFQAVPGECSSRLR